jgi:3-dehydroshikimate dehydratase
MKVGLVSVSFRPLSPEKILDVSKRAGIQGIEWGGDIHVPHLDNDCAKRVSDLSLEAGIECPSYGSYYALGYSEENGVPFSAVLKNAKTLGAKHIRVWAGHNLPSAKASEQDWKYVIADAKRISSMAQEENITIATEFHSMTLTDHHDTSIRLIQSVDSSHFRTYWQPPNAWSEKNILTGLGLVKEYIEHIHIFHWLFPENKMIRRPLSEGELRWKSYLKVIETLPNFDEKFGFLEFFMNDSEDQFVEDVKTLKHFLK